MIKTMKRACILLLLLTICTVLPLASCQSVDSDAPGHTQTEDGMSQTCASKASTPEASSGSAQTSRGDITPSTASPASGEPETTADEPAPISESTALDQPSASSAPAPTTGTDPSQTPVPETSTLPPTTPTATQTATPTETPTETPEPSIPTEDCVMVFFDTGTEDCTLDSVRVVKGARIDAPEVSRKGYILRRWLKNGKEYDFSAEITSDTTLSAEWLERTNLPVTVVELRDEKGGEYSVDRVTRESYVTSLVTVMNADGQYEVQATPSGFKGRGNGSWGEQKKCFRIKFDEKQTLFAQSANRNWVLLAGANFDDVTMMRNSTAYNLASLVFDALEYSPYAVWTDLYVNGEYRGVYVLSEQVRAGEGRVEIESAYGVEDTGYLIEYDAYATGVEGVDYFSINDGERQYGTWDGHSEGIVKYNFTVHSPDPDDYSTKGKITEEEFRAQVAYIQDYVKRVYTAAIVDHDFETLCELVDIDSLVDIYILEEFYKNTDAGYSSFYMYKNPGGKLCFGPPWDFDGTTTAARGSENNPDGIYVAGSAGNNWGHTDSELFAELYKTAEFLSLVKARWHTLSPKIREYFDGLFTSGFYTKNKYAFGRNFVRWQRSGYTPGPSQGTISQSQAEKNWIKNCKALKKWFDGRIDFLDGEWKI